VSLLASAPSLPSLLASHWQRAWSLDLAVALSAGLYLSGVARVRRRWPLRRTLFFLAGIAFVLLALQSGLGAYDARMLTAHMVQHILLTMVAAPLLVLGAPATLASAALPARRRRALVSLLARAQPLCRPRICLAVFAVVILGAHLPAFFDAALRNPSLLALEQISFLAAGLFLWLPLTSDHASAPHRLGGLGRILYMLVAMVPEDLLGAFLTRANNVVYAPYAAAAHALGISAVINQQQAGAIMWVGSSCLMAAGGLYAAMIAMIAEEQRATEAMVASIATQRAGVQETATGPAAAPTVAEVAANGGSA
jgi:putative membrane protein